MVVSKLTYGVGTVGFDVGVEESFPNEILPCLAKELHGIF